MSKICSVGIYEPPFEIEQDTTVEFAKELFQESFRDIKRLLTVFQNGEIKKRHFANDLSWFQQDHSFGEKNDIYISKAVEYGCEAIKACLHNDYFLKTPVEYSEIEAIFYISSTGLSTPSIEARIMNVLPFSSHTKRIPIWGLGCAGGASGLSRAYEYCKAFPTAKVLVLTVELCSLTFQRNDRSKSNLIGTSLFADGVACALIAGNEATEVDQSKLKYLPTVIDTQSTTMKNSEEVMGWDLKNEGLFVIFSKDIPMIIRSWLGPNVQDFLKKNNLQIENIDHFIAHPGGKKVLEAYKDSLSMNAEKIQTSFDVLKEYGNMSSSTVLYVLKRFMESNCKKGDYGLATALGPGFSSELLLLQWGD